MAVSILPVMAAALLVGSGAAFNVTEAMGKGLDPNNIVCPVLATIWNHGALKSDDDGNVELGDMLAGLLSFGTGYNLAVFQAYGITDFDRAHRDTMDYRDRCLPGFTASGLACSNERAIGLSHHDYTMRWVNIFKMHGNQNLEHGISTGTRGGDTNVPDFELCNGKYPCEARFQKFFVQNADAKGRIYKDDALLKLICAARKHGDRGGEYSYASGLSSIPGFNSGTVPAREWQMKAATFAWIDAFGRLDERGVRYMTIDDARAMIMEARLPDDYEKRDWGCLSRTSSCPVSFMDIVNTPVPCDVNEDDAFWQDTDCPVDTGEYCVELCGYGAVCINGKCICARDENDVGMCYKDGNCTSREDKCVWQGWPCHRVEASNPDAFGNPKRSMRNDDTLLF